MKSLSALLTGAMLLLPGLAAPAKPQAVAPKPSRAVNLRVPATVPEAAAVDTDNSSTANLAFVGGTPFLRLHTSWGGLSPEQRTMQVQERINAAFALGPIFPKDITTGKLDGDWVVLLRGKRFFTADPGSAAYHHATPQALAAIWASHLRRILPDLTRQTGAASAKAAASSQ